jgi:hypothetical protein
MGIESVLYRVEPSECEVTDLAEWLRLRGATSGARDATYVLSEPGYWIDLLAQASGSHVDLVQFRVAVTNPVSVIPLLDELISELLVRFGGRVTSVLGKRVLYDRDRLEVMMREFTIGRERFTRHHGDEFILPVSADEVFSRLRAMDVGNG